MCLILFSYNTHPLYKLILASNRDEFYNRPTRSLFFWDDSSAILAGQDEKDKGTWLGVSSSGKFSGITNFRSPDTLKVNAPSRGLLVSDYLQGSDSPDAYLERIKQSGSSYNGFNLLAGDLNAMYYYSNRGAGVREVNPGIYGLSNAFLDTPWPKVVKGKRGLAKIISTGKEVTPENLFTLLSDRVYPPEKELPETGVGSEWERILSPMFIESDIYGTRTSTIILIDNHFNITVTEKTFCKTETGVVETGEVSRTLGVS